MELIKRTSLFFREGSSDKVYEVDLCLVAPDRYVVNFRYGRRGANLKEGTKTDQPVPLKDAEKAFNQLVSSKTKKGYQELSPNPTTASEAESSASGQTEILLQRLNVENPRLDRTIWRVGELQLKAAVPLLIPLIGTGEALRDYCIAWALGYCNDASAVLTLERLYQDPSTPEFVKRISFEAMLKLVGTEKAEEMQFQLLSHLPAELRTLIENNTIVDLKAYLNQHPTDLDSLYQSNRPQLRSMLLEILRTVPLRPNYFKPLRHIFKIAEYRRDAEVFGILAYRFETEAEMYYYNPYAIQLPDNTYLRTYSYGYNPETGRYERQDLHEIQNELRSPNSKIAYNNKTRDYLRRRVWRTLRKLGEANDLDYVSMAVGVLLSFTDADVQPIRHSLVYRWEPGTWQSISTLIDWDKFAGYLAFGHILYDNSSRYELAENSLAWRCIPPYKPGHSAPAEREEAFPELWNRNPQALLQLLFNSRCYPVQEFAVKAIRYSQTFLKELGIESMIELLKSEYLMTAELGFELAQNRYQPNQPNLELMVAVVNCLVPTARQTGQNWIEQHPSLILGDSQAIASLISSPYSDTRQFTRRLLTASALSDTLAQTAIAQILSRLLTLPASEADRIRETGETLLLCFTGQLRSLHLTQVQDLLNSPILELQELGARILLNHETPSSNLPSGLIDSLIHSAHASIRTIGVQLFGQLPDATLLNSETLLLSLTQHELADIRNAIRPVLQRLGTTYPEFGLKMAETLIAVLFTPETIPGSHRDLIEILQTDLTGWMRQATLELTRKLLQSQSPIGQELGGMVMSANVEHWADHVETSEIVQFASYEVQTVRKAACDLLLNILPRLRTSPAELAIAVRLLESQWEDTREFGFRVFHTFFTPEYFTPTLLVSLCDSNHPEVRKFGRDKVTQCFQAIDGADYLLKFSEHPNSDMQLFATNYLEQYASNHPEYLEALQPYFIRVLSQVNRGRVAKQRIFAFLEREALKSEILAQIVAQILTRQSATIVIKDKAKTIQTLLKIHQAYPHIPVPLQVQPIPVKS